MSRVPKITPALLGLLMLCSLATNAVAQTASDYINTGLTDLTQQNLAGLQAADSSFDSALGLEPANQTANVLKAVTRLALLPSKPEFTTLLSSLGITVTNADPYSFTYTAKQDLIKGPIPAPGSTTDLMLAYVNTTLLPEINNAVANLQQVTDTGFLIDLSAAQTSKMATMVDYGDVKIALSALLGFKAALALANTENLSLPLPALYALGTLKELNLEKLLDAYPTFLTYSTQDQRAAAKAAFQSANAAYQTGSNFIQARTAPGTGFVFTFPAGDAGQQKFQNRLAGISAALNGPTAIEGVTLNLVPALTTTTQLRSLRPQVVSTGFLEPFNVTTPNDTLKPQRAAGGLIQPGTWPDPKLAGVLPGGTQALLNQAALDTYLLYPYPFTTTPVTISTSISPAAVGDYDTPAGYANVFVAGGNYYSQGTFNTGDSVTVSAFANYGYNFVNWTENGVPVSTSPNYTFTASANRTLVANFTLASGYYSISASASPSSGGAAFGGGAYTYVVVAVNAFPNPGYSFVNWTENGVQVSTSQSYSFIAANRTLVANFAPSPGYASIATSALPSGGGVASLVGGIAPTYTGPVLGNGVVSSGSNVTVIASPLPGYNFVKWTEGAATASTSASYTFTSSSSRTLVANFTPQAITALTYSTNPATYTKGVAITPNTPTNSGGPVASYSVSPALPAGLSLDPGTGIISGTPTVAGPRATYAVTAINSAGPAMASVSIAVNGIQGSTLYASYTTGNEVPVSSNGFTATGTTVNFNLDYAPVTGTQLMVVQNTGLGFINGTFSNLAQGQTVPLVYNGVTYNFVANYYGGSGNDLVLVWKGTSAFAWGDGGNGQLGNNSTTQSNVPVAVTTTGVLSGKTVAAVAAGVSHSLALCSDGTVAAWGNNGNGQLGNNSTTQSNVPVAVTTTGVLSGKTVVAVAAGVSHSLALCSDGTVAAWGNNGNGQLGNNSTTQSNVPVAVTTTGVLSGKTVVAVATGNSHSLALCSDGTLAAWGYNAYGQLGNNSTTQSNVPVAVTTTGMLAGKTVVAVTVGGIHSLALCSDGTVAAWGYNGDGELGNNSTTNSSVPVAVNTTSGSSALFGKTVVAVAAGYYHSVALCSDGTVAAWGNNANGQLGNNSTTSSSVPVAVNTTFGISALFGKTVVAVATGVSHSLALCSDGTVAAWGRNSEGELGNNSTTDSPVPVAVDTTTLPAGARFTGLLKDSTNNYHTLALVAAPLVAAPTSLAYSTNPATYTVGTPITQNTPSSNGGPVASYSVSPALPAGLTLDPGTGIISGTPTAVTSAGSYTVTATNTGGSTSAGLVITVTGSPTVTTPTATSVTGTAATLGGNVVSSGGSPISATGVVFAPASTVNFSSTTPPQGDWYPFGNSTGTFNGQPVSQTYGQTFTVPASGNVLDSWTFYLKNLGTTPVNFQFYLMAWNGTMATGPVLYQSATQIVPGTQSSYAPFTVNPNVTLVSGNQYVMFINESGLNTGGIVGPLALGGDGSFFSGGSGTSPLGGQFYFLNNGDTFSNVISQTWQTVSSTGFTAYQAAFSPSPQIGGTGVTNVVGTGTTGIFTVNASGLTPGTAYIFSAYATNSVGTSYSSTASFTTLNTPSVTTPTSASVTGTTATLGGNVISNGGFPITATGVVYSPTATNSNPQIGGTGVTNVAGTGTTGVFTVNVSGLTPGTTYTYSVYATNSAGTTYSTTGSFTTPGITSTLLNTARYYHTATLLPNGKVLVAGGQGKTSVLASAELYDPATGIWSATGSLANARKDATATLLPNGKVLVMGGYNGSTYLASAEVYDPATGTWSATGSLATARQYHTATLLPNGKVLVAGGYGVNASLASAELYNPATGTWSATGSLAGARYLHTATLLPNGKVLVSGGNNGSSSLNSAIIYDPSSGTWSATGSLVTGRYAQTATLLANGTVLVAGGYSTSGTTRYLVSAEIYNPSTGAWSATGSLANARQLHTATLLPNGTVLVAGGYNFTTSGNYLSGMEIYNPSSGTWSATTALSSGHDFHTATLLANGKVLVAGGYNGSSALATTDLYDPSSGAWNTTGSLATARSLQTATLLPDGKVLVAGGANGSTFLTSAEIYNPATGICTATGSLATPRNNHIATLLTNGKVLIAGGYNSTSGYLTSAEIYDPAISMWSTTGPMAFARAAIKATLLPNGKVLVAGSYNSTNGFLASAEVYDPATGSWSGTGSLTTAREYYTSTLLPNGKVLVAGGYNGAHLGSAEIYDSTSGLWSATGSLGTAREFHTATLLANGKVLVAGGYNSSSGYLTSAEIYDPATGSWTATGSLTTARQFHTATLLPDGKVLVAGGYNSTSGYLTSAEVYDSATGSWTATSSMATGRYYHTATLLANGNLLVAGGNNGISELFAAELYDVGLGFSNTWQPVISSASFNAAGKLVLAGSGFNGISSASGGNGGQDSATNYPLVQMRRLDNEQTSFLLSDPTASVSSTAFTSLPVAAFPGYALVTVFANGIPSAAFPLVVATPIPTVTTPTSANVTGTGATLGGNVASDGGVSITARGVVVVPTSMNSNPLIGGTGVTTLAVSGTTGAFTLNVSGLTPGTAYSFKAYATNSVGTSYSSTGAFATGPTIGAGTGIGEISLDAGTRTNVDTSHDAMLPAGTYIATDFNFSAGQNGNVQPFLATLSAGAPGTNPTYRVIALGEDNSLSGIIDHTVESVPFGLSAGAIFTLTSPTAVYAGFTNSAGLNPVLYATNGLNPKNDDQKAPAFSSFAVGTSLSAFSNPGLAREYAFSVIVTPVSVSGSNTLSPTSVSALTINVLTGYLQQSVTVTNSGSVTTGGFQLRFTGIPGGASVTGGTYDAGTNSWVVNYGSVLNAGQSQTVSVQYSGSLGGATPTVAVVPPPTTAPSPDPSFASALSAPSFNPATGSATVVLNARPGRIYEVEYADGGSMTFHALTGAVLARSAQIQFVDDGTVTGSKPTAAAGRFYRAIDLGP